MGSPREHALQGVWASRVTDVVEAGSSGDEGVLDSGSGCAYAEENGIVELFTEESGKDDPRSSPSVCPHLFLLTVFFASAFWILSLLPFFKLGFVVQAVQRTLTQQGQESQTPFSARSFA